MKRKLIFFFCLLVSFSLYGQTAPALQSLLEQFRALPFPFENDHAHRKHYQAITGKDSTCLVDFVRDHQLLIVNPITESPYGNLDDTQNLLDEEEANLLTGGAILADSHDFVVVYFLFNETGLVLSINKKTGKLLSGFIGDHYSGMGHAQVGRSLEVGEDRRFKIEEACWGSRVEIKEQYTLHVEYRLSEEGEFIPRTLKYTTAY